MSNGKNFVYLTVFSIFEKIIAFIYQALIASVLGASFITDCYFSASQLFDLIDSTVLGALVVVTINRFAHIIYTSEESIGFQFLSNLNSILFIIMLSLSVIVFIFANPISYGIAPGFDTNMRLELIRCIRILCFIPPIMVYATLAQGLLRLKKRFVVVNSRSLCISICGMLAILLYYIYKFNDTIALCIGYISANLIFAFLLNTATNKYGKIKLTKPIFDTEIKNMVVLAIPAIVSSGIVRISMIIDQVISSTLGEGVVSYLNYSQSLYNIVSTIFISNLCMIMLTDLTNLCVENEYSEMLKKMHSIINVTTLILAPITLLSLCYSREIVSIIYERGAFTHNSTEIVGNLLFFYSFGFIPAMLNSVHTQVLHSFGKMKTAMIISILSFSTNIVLSVILSHYIGVVGIAIGTTVSSIIVIFIYKDAVKKHLLNYNKIWTTRFIINIAIGLFGCAIVIYLCKKNISSYFLSFIMATILSFVVFIGILLLLKENTVIGFIRKNRIK